MCDSRDVEFMAVLQVVESVRRVVASHYGPQCSQTLLTSSTGKAVVTSDGYTILQALQPAHPVARLITMAIDSCHAHTMDGCKTFLLYLSSILRTIQHEADAGRFSWPGTNIHSVRGSQKGQAYVRCAKTLQSFLKDIAPILYKRMAQHCDQQQRSDSFAGNMTDLLAKVCGTTLAPHFNPTICSHFTKVIVSLLPQGQSAGTLRQSLQVLVKKFFVLIVKTPGRPYSDCTCFSPLLIPRDFALQCSNVQGEVRLLMLCGNVDSCDTDENDVKDTFILKQASCISGKIHTKRKVVSEFASECGRNHVNILLCTQGIAPYALDIFRYHMISVISNVLKEDMEMLQLLTGKIPLVSIRDEQREVNIVPLEGMDRVAIGGRMYTHLKIKNPKIQQLIVCAPTIGLCDQVTLACQKALNSMLLCFHNDPKDRDMHTASMYCEENDINGSIRGDGFAGSSDKIDQMTTVFTENIQTGCAVNITGPEKEEIDNYANCTINMQMEIRLDRPVMNKQNTVDQPELLTNQSGKNLNENLPSGQCRSQDADVEMGKVFHFNRILVIPGGGGFDVLLSNMLLEIKRACKDVNMSGICNILIDSVMYTLNILHANTTETDEVLSKPRDYLQAKTVLEHKVRDGVLWGLNRRGRPCNMREQGVYEPLGSKLHVFLCVLELVVQLLKVDKIVSVGKLKADGD